MSDLGIQVFISDEILANAPVCDHGPTLLFERQTKHGRRKFYACSACRDRKDCHFFQWADTESSKIKSIKATSRQYAKSDVNCSPDDGEQRLTAIRRMPQEQRQMCRTCSKLLMRNEMADHKAHSVQCGITDYQLKMPTYLLPPLENARKNAQFFFSKRSTEFITTMLRRLKVKSVICIGCPRIHEHVLKHNTSMKSLLLDMDQRLCQFYNSAQFLQYNMFNGHFFGGDQSRKLYYEFLRTSSLLPSNNLAILLDPPFGGLTEPIAHSLHNIQKDWLEVKKQHDGPSCSEEISIFWMFPYFMEKKVVAALPSLTMLDYEVDYDNHQFFKSSTGKGRRVSPIRIFTNVAPGQIELPPSEGYRLCVPCDRYVSKNNNHCMTCKICPSKNGRPYVHCKQCKVCVKDTYVHCLTCKICHIKDQCSKVVPGTGCYSCGKMTHKRRHCPDIKKRRKKNQVSIKPKKLK